MSPVLKNCSLLAGGGGEADIGENGERHTCRFDQGWSARSFILLVKP